MDPLNNSKTITKIQAPKGAIYLTEFLTELPYGIFNKVETGCGMTTLALNSKDPYIVAVPFTHLIENKCAQEKQVFPFYGTVSKSQFNAFMSSNNKVMVTYDSLPKLVNWLKELGENPEQEWKLLVDEYQVLLSQYKFRNAAFIGTINEVLKFDHFTLGSATPLTPEFTPGKLSGLPITEVDWVDTHTIKVVRQKTTRPLSTVKKLAKAYASGAGVPYNGMTSTRGVFFLNSVKGIASVIKAAGLTPEEVTVICGKNAQNKEILGKFYSTVKDTSAITPVTFVTSSGWQGIDLYADNALSYVVTDKALGKHTLMDVTTSVIQAAGRVRNPENPFKGQLVHVFNNGFSEKPKKENGESNSDYDARLKAFYLEEDEEFFKGLALLERESKFMIKVYDDYTQAELNDSINYKIKNDLAELPPLISCVKDANGDWSVFFDEGLLLLEKFQYTMIQKVYRDGLSLRKAYAEAGFDVTQAQTFENPNEAINKVILIGFVEAFKLYTSDTTSPEDKERVEAIYPLIKEAVDKLGAARCASLKYTKGWIVNELQACTGEVSKLIQAKLVKLYPNGTFVPSVELKAKLSELYNEFTSWSKKKPKASDVTDFLPSSVEVRQRVDGKLLRGFTINYVTNILNRHEAF